MKRAKNTRRNQNVSSKRTKRVAATHFDNLSNDVHLSIISWTEKLLRQKKDHLNFLWLLFSNTSPFRGVTHSCFNSVTFWDKYKTTKASFELSSLAIAADDLVRSGQYQKLIEQIFTVCGSSLRTVSCFKLSNGNDHEKHLKTITTLVLNHCPNVENLKWRPFSEYYWDACDEMVKKYGSQLRSFEWMQKTKLKKAMPNLSICDGLNQFICRDEPNAIIIPQLLTIGSTLEELDLRRVTSKRYANLLEAIDKNCRNLSIIKMQSDLIVGGEDKYTSLLCSYGAQLKKADVQGVSLENMEKISRACTNLQTEYSMLHYSEASVWDDIRTLGPLLVKLKLGGHPCDEGKTIRAMERCTNIRELDIVGCYELEGEGQSDLECLFTNSSFRALESLTIHKYSANKRNDTLIASKTGNLKKFSCSVKNDLGKGFEFHGIVSRNVQLEYFDISDEIYANVGERTVQTAIDIICKIVGLFSKCRSLNVTIQQAEVKIVKQAVQRNMYRKLRFSGESLKISFVRPLHFYT